MLQSLVSFKKRWPQIPLWLEARIWAEEGYQSGREILGFTYSFTSRREDEQLRGGVLDFLVLWAPGQ